MKVKKVKVPKTSSYESSSESLDSLVAKRKKKRKKCRWSDKDGTEGSTARKCQTVNVDLNQLMELVK